MASGCPKYKYAGSGTGLTSVRSRFLLKDVLRLHLSVNGYQIRDSNETAAVVVDGKPHLVAHTAPKASEKSEHEHGEFADDIVSEHDHHEHGHSHGGHDDGCHDGCCDDDEAMPARLQVTAAKKDHDHGHGGHDDGCCDADDGQTMVFKDAAGNKIATMKYSNNLTTFRLNSYAPNYSMQPSCGKEGGMAVFRYAELKCANTSARLDFSKYVDDEDHPEPLLSARYTTSSMRVHKYDDKLSTVAKVVPEQSSYFSNPTSYYLDMAMNVDIIGVVALAVACERMKEGPEMEGHSHSH